jgi:predicted acyl esterase
MGGRASSAQNDSKFRRFSHATESLPAQRQGEHEPSPGEPNSIYEIRIRITTISFENMLQNGHRIRLEIFRSNFTTFK